MSLRPRIRSCAVCQRRKIRCDKGLPCSQCTRSDFECSYPVPTVRRRRKATVKDIANRISQMENTIGALSIGQVLSQSTAAAKSLPSSDSVSSAAVVSAGDGSNIDADRPGTDNPGRQEGLLFEKGTAGHYVNEVLLTRAIRQEDDVRTALATPRSESSHNVRSSTCDLDPISWLSSPKVSAALWHPQGSVAVRLWKVFVDSVDPIVKVTHLPTAEAILYTVKNDPDVASDENLAFCFAIYYAAITALFPSEVLEITGEDTDQALCRYRSCLEQSLTRANFLDNPTITLLQALAIHGAAMRVHSSTRAAWIIDGLVIRAATSMGLHKDGSDLGLSPFESEMRRRLWWYLQGKEGRVVEDHGLQNSAGFSLLQSVELPRNLHDSDISTETKELPPSRPEWTRMTLSFCFNQVSQAWTRLFQMSSPANSIPDEAVRKHIINEAVEKVEGILQRCNFLIPEQRMAIRSARLILWKADVISRRQWEVLRSPDDHDNLPTESEFVEAVQLLEQCNDLWQDYDLAAFQWIVRALPQYHVMLVILRHLSTSPRNDIAKRAFQAVETHFENFKASRNGSLDGIKWTVLTTLREKVAALMRRPQKACEHAECDGSMCSMRSQETDREGLKGRGESTLRDWDMMLEDFPFNMDTDFRLEYAST